MAFQPNNEAGLDAVVLTFGHATSHFGFAGDDVPKVQLSSTLGNYPVSSKASTDSSSQVSSVVQPFDTPLTTQASFASLSTPIGPNGLIKDLEGASLLFDAAMARLAITPSEHPFCCAEPLHASSQDRVAWLEQCFESYNMPALFTSKSDVLACFANGRTTGLVVDCGHGSSHVVSVLDGLALEKSCEISEVGGAALDQDLLTAVNHLLGPKKHVRSRFEVNAKMSQTPLAEALWDQARLAVVREMKETLCRVSDLPMSELLSSQIPKVPYELPDGTILDVGAERFNTPERLFASDPSSCVTQKPLQEMALKVIQSGEIELRKDLCANVILTGGGSTFDNLAVRLEREMTALLPAILKVKVIAANPSERRIGVWMGGSILASLGSFHDLWMSKSEYEEEGGASLLRRKCP